MWAPLPSGNPTSDTTYPVMFFIVGGDYDFDGAQNGAVDGRGIAASANAVVVVANSRLGVFGYLGSEELRSINPGNNTGNYGILDQRLALQWVKLNAAAFNGGEDTISLYLSLWLVRLTCLAANIDSNRVMIFGESSGAGCVTNHLVTAGSRGLFSTATMESGAFLSCKC